jgi:hypothetical protein
VRAWTPMAREVVAGSAVFSMSRTGIPKRASSIAAVIPVGPPPAIRTGLTSVVIMPGAYIYPMETVFHDSARLSKSVPPRGSRPRRRPEKLHADKACGARLPRLPAKARDQGPHCPASKVIRSGEKKSPVVVIDASQRLSEAHAKQVEDGPFA